MSNKVTIRFNHNVEMMSITKDDKSIFYGNYWDFHNDPQTLERFLTDLGMEVDIKKAKRKDFE